MLHLPLSFFGLYTPETRLMLDAYAGFLDRLRGALPMAAPPLEGMGGIQTCSNSAVFCNRAAMVSAARNAVLAARVATTTPPMPQP